MLYVLSRIVDKLPSWEGFLVLLTIGLLWLSRRPQSRRPRRWLMAVVALYTIVSIPLLSYFASRVISPFAPFADSEEPLAAIVLLGAGSGTALGLEQRIGLLTDVGGGRVLEAARIYRALPQPWVISSGGTTRWNYEPSALSMQRALVQLGVPSDRILLESTSIDTHQEAVVIAPMLRQLHAETFALVTTRIHMPRALALFRRQGLTPVPAVVPDEIPAREWVFLLRPTIDGLQRGASVYHELVGMAYYKWRGWI